MSGARERSQPVSTRVQVFIAPVDREVNEPTRFDAVLATSFDPENPPSPWVGLGRAEKFDRSAADETIPVQAGAEGAVVAQFRKRLEAGVAFEFRYWGKLQLVLATGGTHWNLLEQGGAAPVAGGSTASRLEIGEAAATFRAGDLVSVDLDYEQQDGYVGLWNVSGYVSPEQTNRGGRDFVRQVTCNVGRVSNVSGGCLTLEQPLPAGIPPTSAAVQKVLGFADREGGTFRQEWSALFIEETVYGGRVFYYYPRLQSQPPASERRAALAGEYHALLLQARLSALPSSDEQDGVSALWYRFYIPPEAGFSGGLR